MSGLESDAVGRGGWMVEGTANSWSLLLRVWAGRRGGGGGGGGGVRLVMAGDDDDDDGVACLLAG